MFAPLSSLGPVGRWLPFLRLVSRWESYNRHWTFKVACQSTDNSVIPPTVEGWASSTSTGLSCVGQVGS